MIDPETMTDLERSVWAAAFAQAVGLRCELQRIPEGQIIARIPGPADAEAARRWADHVVDAFKLSGTR